MKKIKLMNIVIDPEIMVREVNAFVVGNYAESMRAGNIFPPVVIDSKSRLVCGHTRYAAYKKVYNPDYEIDCIITKNTKDVDLIIEAAGDNAKHGHPLDTYEKKKVALRLQDHNISPEKISSILGITVGRVETWAGMTICVIGNNGRKKQEPFKRGFEHMQGRTVPEKEYTEHKNSDMGVSLYFHASKMIQVLSRSNWTATDDKTTDALIMLNSLINQHLKKIKK